MSSGQPKPHAEMLMLALEVIALLAEGCTRIAIAGSLRRGKAMVGDIEIVCQPDFQALPATRSAFILTKQNAVNHACDNLRYHDIFQPRLNNKGNPQSWGDQQKWFRYKGVNVDLYSVLPGYSWGRELLIRTGPGDANAVLVTRDGVRNREGYVGVLPEPYQFRDRELYAGNVHVETPEEKDVFHALGLPYIVPFLRSVEMYQRWASRRVDPLPDEWVKKFDSRTRGWVGAPNYGNDVWLPSVYAPGKIEREPRLLELVKLEAEVKIA